MSQVWWQLYLRDFCRNTEIQKNRLILARYLEIESSDPLHVHCVRGQWNSFSVPSNLTINLSIISTELLLVFLFDQLFLMSKCSLLFSCLEYLKVCINDLSWLSSYTTKFPFIPTKLETSNIISFHSPLIFAFNYLVYLFIWKLTDAVIEW